MKQYEIIHKGKKYVTMSIDGLMKTLIDFCTELKINPNEIESCTLVKPTNRFSKLKIKHSYISDLVLDCQRSSGTPFSTITGYTLKVDFVSKNNGDADKEVNDLFSRLLEIQHDK